MINLLFPKLCYACKKEGEYLCTDCFKKLIRVDPIVRCHVCNKEIRIGLVHSECEEFTYLDGLLNLTFYDGIIKGIIYDYKYNLYFSISESIAIMMKDFLGYYTFNGLNSIITFVPASKKKLKLRGFSQSELLARQLANLAQINYINILIKKKDTAAQAKLHKQGRTENLLGVFELVNQKIEGGIKDVLIIDDVFTTGATLNECAKVIKHIYPKLNVYGFVVAKARG